MTKPPQPIEKSTAGASLLAHVIVSKVADHLPVHRQAKMMRRFGVEIADQTMCGWMRQSAELLVPLYQRLVLPSHLQCESGPTSAQRRDMCRSSSWAQTLIVVR